MNGSPWVDSATPDRHRVLAVRQRFLQWNAQRYNQALDGFNVQQQVFIQQLPVLFHCHHPLLPGFSPTPAPKGISGYTLNDAPSHLCKRVQRCVQQQSLQAQEPAIWGLYAMGSLGSIAQTLHSDIDIWICHNPQLSPEDTQALQQKAKRISLHAATLGLEVHFFMVNPNHLCNGHTLPLSEESSGSAQHLLLLDEFYRSSLYLAGRMPVWWFVPPEWHTQDEYTHYAQQLLNQHYLPEHLCMDLGNCSEIPAQELIGAGLWQLYKAIESPYKSLLKVLLLEAYAHHLHHQKPLCWDFKYQLYHQPSRLQGLDAYVASYQRVEDYLKEINDPQRLEQVRQCLYFKLGVKLSKVRKLSQMSPAQQQLMHWVQHWGWHPKHLEYLDHYCQWPLTHIKQQHQQLLEAFNYSLKILDSVAKQQPTGQRLHADDYKVLHNKLTAAFGYNPGKMIVFNRLLTPQLPLAHVNKSGSQEWKLLDHQQQLLLQKESACALVADALYNHIITPHTALRWGCKPVPGLQKGQQVLHGWLSQLPKTVPHLAFEQAARVTHMLILVNWPNGETLAAKAQPISNQYDPLCYGPHQENKLQQFNILMRNSWGEMIHAECSGPEAFFELLNHYWKAHEGCAAGTLSPFSLNIHVLDNQPERSVVHRLKTLLHNLTEHFKQDNAEALRYLVRIGQHLYCIYLRNHQLLQITLYDEADLWLFLAVPQRLFHGLTLDHQCLQGHWLHAISRLINPHRVSVFYKYQAGCLHIIVIDALGTVFSYQLNTQVPSVYLSSWVYFLRNSLNQLQSLQEPRATAGDVQLALFEIKHSQGSWQVHPKALPSKNTEGAHAGIKVLLEEQAGGKKNIQLFPTHGSNAPLTPPAAIPTATAPQGFIQDIIFAQPKPRIQLIDYIKARHTLETTILRPKG